MSEEYREYPQRDEDDGRVIADMSDVSRTPLIMPHFGTTGKSRREITDEPDERPQQYQQPVQLDSEERRAMIGGAVSAALLVGGAIALAFAALILLILKLYG